MFTLYCLVDNNALDNSFHAEHGLSFAIATSAGQVLFDTGQSGKVLLHNAARLGLDLHRIDALALSHAHYDHTGGLEAFLQNSRGGIPLHAHPDLFRERFSAKDGQPRGIGLRMPQADLARRTILKLSAEPDQILPGIWTTGEITPRTEFEGRSRHHYIRINEEWQPDPYRDDMALVLEARSGLILVCGCCHAGLLNTLAHVQRIFPRKNIAAILGGAHLAQVDPTDLEHTIEVLRTVDGGATPSLYLNHCTGERALAELRGAFGEKAHACPAGTVLTFE
ncbi:MAG: MBL fold metallo-hydrolase [Anaerolineales bacterium]|nr:MBL fold metallo-hydrolase [Anaerolineales bacterium]